MPSNPYLRFVVFFVMFSIAIALTPVLAVLIILAVVKFPITVLLLTIGGLSALFTRWSKE